MSHRSGRLHEHFRSPLNMGTMADPDVVGIGTLNGRPPQTEIYLRVREKRIVEASFTTFGCAISMACGSVLTEMIKGKSLAEAWDITPAAIVEVLEDIPSHRQFCADLAVKALQHAIMRLASEMAKSNAVETSEE